MSNLESFDVSKLDISGVSDADLQGSSDRPRFIREPGIYNLEIVDHKLYASEGHKDGAGKQWGSVLLKAQEVGTGAMVSGFVSVPLETLVHTSRDGKTSTVRTGIFTSLVRSLTGQKISTEQIPEHVQNLSALLTGGTIRARVGYAGDYVNYIGKDEAGNLQFDIQLKSGGTLLDADGEPMTFSSRDAAVNYYAALNNNRKPEAFMTLLSFLAPEVVEEEVAS